MSIPRNINVNCPQCGRKYQTTVFESINSDFAPNVAETIISGERFCGTCPKCGFVAHLEYDVLYHDLEHGAAIYVIHKNNNNYSQMIADVRSIHLLPYRTTRIVSDMNELREKVACLEVGKDDRIVELCKFFLATKLMEQQPNFNFQDAFYTISDGKNIVLFYDDKRKKKRCYLDDQIYEFISDLFSKQLSQMDNSPYKIIDSDWASKFFETLQIEDVDLSEEQGPTGNEENDNSPLSKFDIEYPVKQKDVITHSRVSSEQPPLKRTLVCRKCGAKLLSDSLFCSYCGTKI